MKEEARNNDGGLHQFRLGSPETALSSTNIAERASADKDNFCAHDCVCKLTYACELIVSAIDQFHCNLGSSRGAMFVTLQDG